MIKGISPVNLAQWKLLLRKHGINTRHGANELNWQTEDLCQRGLKLKLALAKEFEREDVAAGDLCFAIKMNPKAGLFGSVIIRKVPLSAETEEMEHFDILHTVDFNPNSKKFVSYRKNLQQADLGPELIGLCRYYLDQTASADQSYNTEAEDVSYDDASDTVFQCSFCLSIYDEQTGDLSAGVAAGTLFRELTDTFRCPLCEADKSSFYEVERPKIYS